MRRYPPRPSGTVRKSVFWIEVRAAPGGGVNEDLGTGADGETEIHAPPPPTPEGGAAEVHIPAGPSQVFMRTLVRSDTLRTEEVCLATALTMNPYFSPGTGMKFLRKPMLLELGFKVSVPLQVRPSPNHSVVAPCQAPPR